MVSVDKKIFWDLPETVMWICTRDEQRVAGLCDMNENEKLRRALYEMRVERAAISLPGPSGSNLGADLGPANRTAGVVIRKTLTRAAFCLRTK